MSKELCPLSDMQEVEIPRVDWQLELPEYAPSHEVGINTAALSRFARLAGYKKLTIKGEDMGVTKHTPGLDGVGADGSATASGIGNLTHPDLVRTESSSGKDFCNDDTLDAFHWRTGSVTINTEEMTSRLSQIKGGALRNSSAWSKELNTAMKKSISRAATKSLIGQSTPSSMSFFVGSVIGSEIGDINIEHALLGVAFAKLLGTVRGARLGHRGNQRLSLLPSYQVDRLLVVKGLSKATRFAKPISS